MVRHILSGSIVARRVDVIFARRMGRMSFEYQSVSIATYWIPDHDFGNGLRKSMATISSGLKADRT